MARDYMQDYRDTAIDGCDAGGHGTGRVGKVGAQGQAQRVVDRLATRLPSVVDQSGKSSPCHLHRLTVALFLITSLALTLSLTLTTLAAYRSHPFQSIRHLVRLPLYDIYDITLSSRRRNVMQ